MRPGPERTVGTGPVLDVVAGQRGAPVTGRRSPGHVQARRRTRRSRHRRRRRCRRLLSHISQGDSDRHRVAGRPVGSLDRHRITRLGLEVIGHTRSGLDTPGRRIEAERGGVGALHRIRQRVAVGVGRRGNRRPHIRVSGGVLRNTARQRSSREHRRTVRVALDLQQQRRGERTPRTARVNPR